MASEDLQGYKIQGIYYLNKRTHRIQQNVGGACPLLALCNTLFLNHQINYNKGGRRIKFQELNDCLTQHLHNMLNTDVHTGMIAKTELEVDKDQPLHSGVAATTSPSIATSTKDDIHCDDDDKKTGAGDVADEERPLPVMFDDEDEDVPDTIMMDVTTTTTPEEVDSDKIPPQPIAPQTPPPPQSQTAAKTSATATSEQKDAESVPLSPHPETETETEQKTAVDPALPGDKSATATSSSKAEAAEVDSTLQRTAEEKEFDARLKRMDECVRLFPKLEEGLDINIKFSDACDFEGNPGYRMFSHYGFKLFHGWVVDPKNEALYKLIGEKSYDETIDFLISDPKSDASDEEKQALEADKDVVRKFFAESATQLTSYGLARLYKGMDVEDELAIFFRNNHFSTIVKHAGVMYEFVTDEGIVDADPQITWQTLLQISGDEQFVNNKFQSIHSNISQYTQIAHYNRTKFAADNGISGVGVGVDGVAPAGGTIGTVGPVAAGGGEQKSAETHSKYPPYSLIGVLNTALDFIDTAGPFETLRRVQEDLDPLVSHGVTQRTTDTFDRFICKDYLDGTPLVNERCPHLRLKVRSFEMRDAKHILDLMSTSRAKEDALYRNIDFMHHDHKYALVLEIESVVEEQLQPATDPSMARMMANPVIGLMQYEWLRFNNWDWRESDWEDFDADHMYTSGSSLSHYERKRQLKDAGVRIDWFVRIVDFCVASDFQRRMFGRQLLQALMFAFPSGTRFGLDVNAENTPATKCLFKCGFNVARFEQVPHVRYKMTAESGFTLSEYQHWLMTSQVAPSKSMLVQKLAKTNTSAAASSAQKQYMSTPQLQTADDGGGLLHPKMHTDVGAHSAFITSSQPQSHAHAQSRTNPSLQSTIPTTTVPAHDDAYDDDDFEDVDDQDMRDVHHHHADTVSGTGAAAAVHPNKKRARAEDTYHGTGSPVGTDHMEDVSADEEDCDSDDDRTQIAPRVELGLIGAGLGGMHEMSDMGGGAPVHGGHGGRGSVSSSGGQFDFGGAGNIGGLFGVGAFHTDDFIYHTLHQLNLLKYQADFGDFQITKSTLLHLDPSVVECIIPNQHDKTVFLNWLANYQASMSVTPSKTTASKTTPAETQATADVTVPSQH